MEDFPSSHGLAGVKKFSNTTFSFLSMALSFFSQDLSFSLPLVWGVRFGSLEQYTELFLGNKDLPLCPVFPTAFSFDVDFNSRATAGTSSECCFLFPPLSARFHNTFARILLRIFIPLYVLLRADY
ncbi:hypothetical protein ACTXT7_011653 [Hymenolepis weldensis]